MRHLCVVCFTALLIAMLKYLSPIFLRAMDIEFVKWMSLERVTIPCLPPQNKV